jgi:hypothetical protein
MFRRQIGLGGVDDEDLTGVTGWVERLVLAAVSPEQCASDVATAATITAGLPPHFDVTVTYPLDQIADAVRHVSQSGKVGTVVVTS